ncbi:methyl-accepting chemotaxis protein [Rhodoferax sp.]|uniref:methyl-accepting chemotaxis protein n=1 Tax=Rhodoferax sp. TaxID=50421 RepID=UPI002774F1F5|nr:methyl-accepting chemotaxis protein [Rhodoferax sp.]
MNLLERAGLVRREGEAFDPDAAPASGDSGDAALVASQAPPRPSDHGAPLANEGPVADVSGLSLAQIYASAGVAAASYPAERLLRLLDGLKAMEEGTRRQAIAAMDAADDTWTIADPLHDASLKIAAIEAHAATLRAGVTQAEQDTQMTLGAVQQRQDKSVAEIKRQINELEGLLARELARGAQESAALAATLQSRREAALRELESLMRTVGQFQALVSQFKSAGAA